MSAPGWPNDPTPQPGLPPPTFPSPVAPGVTTQPVPTVPPPPASATPPPLIPSQLSPPSRNRTTAIVGGIAAALVLGVGAFVVFGGDDDKSISSASTMAVASSTPDPASTLPPSSVTVTTIAASTSTTAVSTTTVAATTIPPVDVNAALLQAMPAIDEVPVDWLLFEGADADPRLNASSGYCGGPNWAAAADDQGAIAMVHGPNWDLPDGGWFGLSAFTFGSTEAAAAYMAAIDLQANGCMTDPVVFETSEADYDIFADVYGEDAVWTTAEVNGSFPGFAAHADETTLVIYEEFISTTYDGTEFSLVWTEFQRFERHGRTVLAFWLWGEHDVVGFGNAAEAFSYVPTEIDLDAAALAIRALVVERLRADGLA